MQSNDLRAVNGFDIQDIAGENGTYRQFAENALNEIMDYCPRVSVPVLQSHLKLCSSCHD